jgi:hypothetical protein
LVDLRRDVAEVRAPGRWDSELVAERAEQAFLAERIDLEEAGAQTPPDGALDLERVVEMLGGDPAEVGEKCAECLHESRAEADQPAAKCPGKKGLGESRRL